MTKRKNGTKYVTFIAGQDKRVDQQQTINSLNEKCQVGQESDAYRARSRIVHHQPFNNLTSGSRLVYLQETVDSPKAGCCNTYDMRRTDHSMSRDRSPLLVSPHSMWPNMLRPLAAATGGIGGQAKGRENHGEFTYMAEADSSLSPMRLCSSSAA